MEQAVKLKKGQYLKQLATPKVKAKATTTVIMTAAKEYATPLRWKALTAALAIAAAEAL